MDQGRFQKQVFDILPMLVSYLDADERYVYANRTYEEWLGINPNAIIGKTILELLGEEAYSHIKPHVEGVLRGRRIEYETKLNYKNGTRTVHLIYIPDFNEDGSVRGFSAIVQDISRSVNLENKYEGFFENLPVGLIQLDSSFRYLDANPAYRNWLGYTMSELRSKTVFDVTYPADISRSTIASISFSDANFKLTRFQKRYLTKSGEIVWGQVTSRPVPLANSDDYLVLSSIEDITEQKKMELELEELKEKEDMQRAKTVVASRLSSLGEMASGIAHEINNPLTIVQGKMFQLRRRVQKGDVDLKTIGDELQAIEDTSKRISKIIHGLLAFSGNAEAQPFERFALKVAVDDALALCRERFKSSGVQLQVGEIPEVFVYGRAVQISQVIMNLLSNAFDAIHELEEKWVKIEFETSEGKARLVITDSGAGIPENIRLKMMDPFFTTKPIGKGSGLGLSISKGIMSEHGGALLVNPAATHTQFIVEIPSVVN